jgi:hypothetical protein
MKKANLSLQTIVVAVLVLFVLAVLIFMTGSFLGDFSQQGKSCSLAGGQCQSSSSCSTGSTEIPKPAGGWAGDNCPVCCSFNPLENPNTGG